MYSIESKNQFTTSNTFFLIISPNFCIYLGKQYLECFINFVISTLTI